MEKDCIFCKIVKGEAPATIWYEDENIIAFDSIKPIAETHILVVPKKHIESFMELDNNDVLVFLAKAAQQIIKSKKLEDAYRLVFNGGKFQTVSHLHWHLLGGEFVGGKQALDQT